METFIPPVGVLITKTQLIVGATIVEFMFRDLDKDEMHYQQIAHIINASSEPCFSGLIETMASWTKTDEYNKIVTMRREATDGELQLLKTLWDNSTPFDDWLAGVGAYSVLLQTEKDRLGILS